MRTSAAMPLGAPHLATLPADCSAPTPLSRHPAPGHTHGTARRYSSFGMRFPKLQSVWPKGAGESTPAAPRMSLATPLLQQEVQPTVLREHLLGATVHR